MTAIKSLQNPTSILPLVFFRVAFGLLMLASTLRFMQKGWVEEFYIQPDFHFTYYGFGWIKPLPGDGMYAVFILLAVLCVLITLGFAYRFSMIAFFLLFTYVELIDKAYYLNHYYFVSLLSFLLIFLPLHRAYSVDVWLRPALRIDAVPRWTIGAIRLQIALVYFFAGVAKLNPDWLFRAMPLSIWLPANVDFPLIGWLFDYDWFAFGMSWAGAAFDLTIPFWLSWRKTRPFAYLAVIIFHAMTGLMFNIGMFPWIMIVCTVIFFDENDYPFRWFRFIRTVTNFSDAIYRVPTGIRLVGTPSMVSEKGAFLIKTPLIIFFTLFFVFQIMMPLRHHLYPGNVLWTEEGYRFAWNVMLAEKAGYTTYFVTDPVTGREWMVYPNEHLTRQQVQQMSFQPDMILQFAHHLADEYRQQGMEVEMRVEAYVSVNGRRSALIIDPTVDLAQQPYSLRHKTWLLAFPAS